MSSEDIRNQFDDDFEFSEEQVWGDPEPKPQFLGMTPGQRFILSFLLFLTALILSVFCLLVTGKVGLPF
jgi:hypothetical protein